MRLFSLLLFLCFTTFAQAQVEYYTTDGKNRLTKTELDEKAKITKEKMAKAMGTPMFVTIEIKSTEEKQDSIIHQVAMKFSDKEEAEAPKETFINTMLPDFELLTLEGESISREDLKGKPTLLNFWFTACAPCIDEMPVLNQIYETYKDDFNFVAITFDSQKKVKKFLKKHAFEFTHLVDSRSLIDQLKIENYPKNIILDETGIIRHIEGGIPYTLDENRKMVMGDGKQLIELLEKMK